MAGLVKDHVPKEISYGIGCVILAQILLIIYRLEREELIHVITLLLQPTDNHQNCAIFG